MRIEIADASIPSTLTYFPNFPGVQRDRPSILYLRLERFSEPLFLDTLIHRLPDQSIRLAESIVVRAHKAEAEALIRFAREEQLTKVLLHRTEGRPVVLLHWTGTDYSFDEFDPGVRTAVDSRLLEGLRSADLHYLTRRRGVLLPKIPDFHYEGPNGSHYQAFLRPGLAFFSPEVLESLSFWLLPFVHESSAILVDSGTMIPLALHALQYASVYRRSQDSDVPFVDAIRSYDEDELVIARRIEAALSGREVKKILILNSVRSSGRLLDRIVRGCATGGCTDLTIVSLFSVSPERLSGETVFYDLGGDFQRNDPRDCPDCRGEKPVVRVDPTTYLLELSATAKRVAIDRQHVKSALNFFAAYKGLRAVSVHRTRHDPHEPARHHAIHLDVGRLLEHHVFKSRLADHLRTLQGRFDVVLAPTHQAAVDMAKEVSKDTGVRLIACDEDQLNALPEVDRSALTNASGLLLVDDVITSGTRIRGYKYYLRQLGALRTGQALNVLVGVARTSTDEMFNRITDIFYPLGRVHAIERLHLPDWDERHCPWCIERRLLEEFPSNEGIPESIRSRTADLADTELGLTARLFLHWADVGKEMSLGHNSIFGEDLTQPELFGAVAASIQEMRQAGLLDEEFQPPIARVISPDSYLTGRYYENAIEACILRASRRHDVRTATIENELIGKVTRRLTERISQELRGELLLAIAIGKLPAVAQIDEAFVDAEPGIAAFFRRVFSSRRQIFDRHI